MALEHMRTQWSRFNKMDRLQVGIAVFTLAIVGLVLVGLRVVKGVDPSGTVNDLPASLRPLAYLLFVLCIWSAFQVFDRLFPHWLHLQVSIWIKLAWLGALLLWPVGPMIYYLVVYQRSAKDRPKAVDA